MKLIVAFAALLASSLSSDASPLADTTSPNDTKLQPTDHNTFSDRSIIDERTLYGKYDHADLDAWAERLHKAGGFPSCQTWYARCQRWAGHGSAETKAGIALCTAWAKTCGWRDGKPPPPRGHRPAGNVDHGGKMSTSVVMVYTTTVKHVPGPTITVAPCQPVPGLPDGSCESHAVTVRRRATALATAV